MLTTFDSRVFRVGRRVDVQYDVWLLLLFRWLGIRWVLWMVDGSCGWSEEIRWVELRFSPSRDPICPSYPIIAWDEADSRGSLRNIVEPSYPVGYIGSLYLLDGSGWPLSAPPSSDLLVAVFIVVTACLPTWHRFASARRGVLFVYPQRLSSSPYPHPARPLHLALRICATPKRSCSTSTRVRCAAPPLVRRHHRSDIVATTTL